MIYSQWGNQIVLVLSPAEIQRMKMGDIVRAPDDRVILTYTPDILWLASQLGDPSNLSPEKLQDLLKVGMSRPVVMDDNLSVRRVV